MEHLNLHLSICEFSSGAYCCSCVRTLPTLRRLSLSDNQIFQAKVQDLYFLMDFYMFDFMLVRLFACVSP